MKNPYPLFAFMMSLLIIHLLEWIWTIYSPAISNLVAFFSFPIAVSRIPSPINIYAIGRDYGLANHRNRSRRPPWMITWWWCWGFENAKDDGIVGCSLWVWHKQSLRVNPFDRDSHQLFLALVPCIKVSHQWCINIPFSYLLTRSLISSYIL